MKLKTIRSSIVMAGFVYLVSWLLAPPTPANMVRHSLRAVAWIRSSSPAGINEGSGFFVGEHLVVTAYHVVEGGRKIFVEAYTGHQSKVTRIIASSRRRDFAVLLVAEQAPHVLHPAQGARVGDDVYALGAPLGMRDTVTKGVLSQSLTGPAGERLIQHTAPISPGSSGGPLLDANGDVIGLNNFFLEDGQNVNFALEISVVEKALGHSSHGSGKLLDVLYERLSGKLAITMETWRQPRWEYTLKPDGEPSRLPSRCDRN